jgi:predicted nucleic acid-binding Zn ribbon protein
MGVFVRCWRCDAAFEPLQGDERVCSPKCGRDLDRALARTARLCRACGKPIPPQKRVDARFCSGKCYQRQYRWKDRERRVEDLRKSVVDHELAVLEGLERESRLSRYTPQGVRLHKELRRVDAVLGRRHWGGRDYRECEHCGMGFPMRRDQRYCSARCRVAAHRKRAGAASGAP